MLFNPHIKFEVSTIKCNEEIKGNAKCRPKHSRFEPPFGGRIVVTHRVHLARLPILAIIELFSLALMAAALY